MPGLINCNEYYENTRLLELSENEPRLPFVNAVRGYSEASDHNKKAKLVETIVRTSRTVADDYAPLPEDIQLGLMTLIEQFRDFGPTVVTVPSTYAEARNLIKTFFF